MTRALELVDRMYGGTDEYNVISREAADLLRKQHEALKVALAALERCTKYTDEDYAAMEQIKELL